MSENLDPSKPFHFKRGKTAVLLLHGYTGTCYELREIGDFLAKKDITIFAPLLPGHGTTPQDLNKITFEDWENFLRNQVQDITKQGYELFIIGISFGGNLAYHIATELNIKGIITIGTPRWIRYHWLGKIMMPIHLLFSDYFNKPGTKQFRDKKHIFGPTYTYNQIPLRNTLHFAKFIEKVTPRDLKKITIPTLVIQSISDTIVSPKSASFIFKRLKNTTEKELFWVNGKDHVITIGVNYIKEYDRIYEFIKRYSKNEK